MEAELDASFRYEKIRTRRYRGWNQILNQMIDKNLLYFKKFPCFIITKRVYNLSEIVYPLLFYLFILFIYTNF